MEKLNQNSTSSQLTEGPSTERSSVSEDKEKVVEDPEEKLTCVKGAVSFDDSELTKKELSDADRNEKSVEKQLDTIIVKPSSPLLLKWSNKPVTQAKGKKKKV